MRASLRSQRRCHGASENRLARALMNSVVLGSGSAGAFDLYVEQQAALKKLTRTQLLGQKGYSLAHARGKFRQSTQGAVNRVIAQGGGGEFFKMRLTGVMTVLESVLFLAKARELAGANEDNVKRTALEFAAASAATTAAALEVGAMLQEWLVKQSGSPAAKAMAEIRLGGFKLAGGVLGVVAGIAGAYLDFQDAGKASQEVKYDLAGLFIARSFTNSLASINGIALGLSYAGPLLEYWAEKTGSDVLAFLGRQATRLALGRNFLFASTWILFFAIAGLSIVIGWLDDDAMQKWCKRSGFRKLPQAKEAGQIPPKPEPLYGKPEEELSELFNGFRGVTS